MSKLIRSSSIKTTRQYPRPDHICIDNMYVCLLIVQFLSEPQIEQIQNQGMECNLFVEYPLYFSFLGFKRSNPAIVFTFKVFGIIYQEKIPLIEGVTQPCQVTVSGNRKL